MNGGNRGVAWPELDALLRDGVSTGLPDGDLLHRFVTSPDRCGELAFTALVARHGPMVLGICRRILHDPSEADDAFQATFLVLARRAGSIRTGDSLGPWLHGVSIRVARRLQSVAARRPATLNDGEGLGALVDRHQSAPENLERRLDLEDALKVLPADFRTAIGLCYYDGLTHEEAAVKLGCPVGTVRSRLARGRALLRHRLETRAETGPENLLVGYPLIDCTVHAAARLAAGRSLAGVVPQRVIEVATGVIRVMSRTKLTAAAVVIAIGTMAGWGAWAGQSAPEPGQSGPSQREIDSPPSDRLRGDFGRPLQKRILPQRKKREDTPAAELPADFPAFVVETEPKLGDVDVDPAAVKEIRVIFSKPMMDRSWSWTQGNVYSFPKSTGPIHYLADKRTCVMPVSLEPGKTYVIGINGGRFNNFKEADGKPALDYTIGFRTRPAK